MGSIGATELLIIAAIVLLLFGGGKIADLGKGLGQGIRNFKDGLKDAGADDKDKKEPPAAKAPSAESSHKEG